MTTKGSAVVTLPSDTEVLITRQFDAPAKFVYEAWTTPAYVKQWWGFEESPLIQCDIDLEIGGTWRYVTCAEDGTELGWHGTFRDMDAPNRLVSTEVFEGYPVAEALDTLTLHEADGVTTLRIVVKHTTKENRDGHVNSGMEFGMQHTLDRLDLLTSTMS